MQHQVSLSFWLTVLPIHKGTHMAKLSAVEAAITQVKLKLFILFTPQLKYTALGQTQYK